MVTLGANPIRFRDPALPWGGMTTLSKSAIGMFELLENCYVNSDGNEIRSFPGWKVLFDPATTGYAAGNGIASLDGYERLTLDAVRPVYTIASNYAQQTPPGIGATDKLYIWSPVEHVHGFEQVKGRWMVFGEAGIRREPIYNTGRTAFVTVASYAFVSTSATALTLSAAPDSTAVNVNAVEVGCLVYVEGLTGGGASALNGQRLLVTALVGSVLTVQANIVSSANDATGQTGKIGRTTYSDTNPSDDVPSLCVWTFEQNGSADDATPVTEVWPAHVANRIRDFGDLTTNRYEGWLAVDGRSRRRQKSLPYRVVPHIAGSRLLLAAPGYGCVFQAPAITPMDFTGSPTAGTLEWANNDIYDRPRCVGVPKAVMLKDVDEATATTFHIYSAPNNTFAFGGNNNPTSTGRAGTYKFRAAYRDDATGEVGLCSEEISVTTDATASPSALQGIRLLIVFPGYLMHESAALSINLYRTEKNNDTFYFDRTYPVIAWDDAAGPAPSAKHGIDPSNVVNSSAVRQYFHHVVIDVVFMDDAKLRKQEGVVPLALEQMPMGCKAARTIRGWTIYGGALGDTGPRKELQSGTMSMEYVGSSATGSTLADVNFPKFDEVHSRAANMNFEGADGRFGCGVRTVPPAYAGQALFSQRLFPYPRSTVELNKFVNPECKYDPTSLDTRIAFYTQLTNYRWQIRDTPLRQDTDCSNVAFRGVGTYLVLRRGVLQISEQDHPGVTPSPNTTIISSELDDDIEGIGEMRGQAVVATRSKTYLLGFAQSPVGIPAESASDRFGCVAANSMVEFDGGCAWISDRGPVAMTGNGVVWIGQPLERFFIGETSRYKRDSLGMMRHSWACHDAERGLVYFGVYADRDPTFTITYNGVATTWANASDEAKSRFPCDEVLIWSYGPNAWSVYRPPGGMEIKWMTRGQDADGNSRVFWMDQRGRIAALDDTYSQYNREPLKTTATASSTGTTISVGATLGFDEAALGGGTYVQAGMTLIVTSGLADTEGTSRVATVVSATSGTVTVDRNLIVNSGDSVQIGVKTMTVKTNFVNVKRNETSILSKVGGRYHLWSRFANNPSGGTLPQGCYARVQAVTSRGATSQYAGGAGVHTAEMTATSTEASYKYLGVDAFNEVQENEFGRAASKGYNHQIVLTAVGGAQLRLQDLYAEVQ